MSWKDAASKLNSKYGLGEESKKLSSPNKATDQGQSAAGSGWRAAAAELEKKYQPGSRWKAAAAELEEKYSPEKRQERINLANDWVDRYNKVITGFSQFDQKRNGGYAADVGGGYGGEIDALIRDFGGIEDTYSGLELRDARRQVSALRDLRKRISDGNQFMAQFSDEEDYLRYLADQEAYTENLGGYEKYRDSGDFSEVSQRGLDAYGKHARETEERKNQKKSFGENLLDALAGAGNPPGMHAMQKASFDLAADTTYREPTDRWSQDERAMYGYLYETDREMADSYGLAVNNYYNKIERRKQEEEAAEFGKDHKKLSFAGSVAGNAMGLGMADLVMNGIESAARGTITEKDYMTPFQALGNATGAAAQDLNEKHGTIREDIPVIGGRGWGDAYQLANSFATSFVTANTLGPLGTSAVFFGNAAADTMYDALDRGATDDQAIALGLTAGAAEALGEYCSVSHLLKLDDAGVVKNFFLEMLRQGAIEGEEEVFTSLLNLFSDRIIMGDKSELKTLMAKYMQDNPEADEEAAKKYALKKIANDVAFDFLGGFISGEMGGFAESAIGSVKWHKQYHDIYSGVQQELYDNAAKLNPNSKAVQNAGKRLSDGRNLRDFQVRKLLDLNQRSSIEQAVRQRLNEVGESGNVEAITRAITKQAMGEGLSLSDQTALKSSSMGDMVLREMQSGEIYERTGKTAWTDPAMKAALENAPQGQQETPGREEGGKQAEQAIHNLEGKEVDAAVSEDGKTRIVSTGQEAEIRKIASIRDGNITFEMEDGSVVDAGDIAYGSEGEAILYDTVASLGVGPMMADVLVQGFGASRGISAAVYAKGMQDAFQYGKWGVPMGEMESGVFTSRLTEHQRQQAYQIGRMVATEAAKAKQALKKQEAAGQKGQKEPGKVHFDGDRAALTGMQKTNLEALETIAGALGVQIHVFESETAPSADGKGTVRIGENGSYDPSDGSIHIDLYAGADGKGTMLFTAAHELTHFIKDQSPEKFQALSDFLMEQYGKKGQPIRDLVEGQMAKARKHNLPLDYDGAFEEVVADSMESMLTDGKVLQELRQRDKGLWQTVKDYVLELCRKVREAYKGLKPDSLEGRLVAEMKDAAEEMRRLFVEGLLDAGENFTGSEGQKNSTREGGMKMQIREIGSSGKFYVQADRQVLTGTDPEAWGKQISNYINETIRKEQDVAIPTADGHVLLLTGRSAYKLSDQHVASIEKKIKNLLPDDVYARKGRAATHIDELIQVARFREYKSDLFQKHENDIGEDGFNYYEANFMDFDGRYYRIRFSAGINANEETVYSIGQIRERRSPAGGGSSSNEALKNGRKPSNNTIIYTSEEKSQEVKSAILLAYEKALEKKETDVKKKFSMREPVEYTENLVALHNLTEEKLKKALNLGGFPMPSIAITKADIPHTNFGDITLVFGRETIDPKANKKNVVYSADAWTPTVPATEYEEDKNAHIRISQTLRGLEQKIDDSFRSDLKRVYLDLEGSLNRYGGEEGLIQHVSDNYGLKSAYLEDSGRHVDRVTKQEEADLGFSPEAEGKYRKIMDILGVRTAEEMEQVNLQEARRTFGSELEAAFPGITKSPFRMGRIFSQVVAYLKSENKGTVYNTVTDVTAMKKAMDDTLDFAGYNAWVRNLFSGIEKSSGVYNNKPLFTASGNRRTFQQTHLPVTLNNIVKAMASQNGGSTKNIAGFNGIKTLRAGTAERFKSIEAMHKGEGRLQNLTEEQFDKVQSELQDRMYGIIENIDQEGEKSRESNPLIRYDAIGEILMEISEKGKYNVGDIQAVFRQYGKEISDDTAMDVKKLLYDVSQMPVNLFEAKPERAIGFEEVKAAILPEGTNQGIVDGLRDKGVPVKLYEAGNDGQRLELVNALENVKFSLRDQDVQKMNAVLEKQNEKLREDVASLKALLKLQKSVTGGKLLDKKSVDTAARFLMKNAGAKGNTAELSGLLNDVYAYMAGDDAISWEGIMEKAQPAADWIADHMEAKQTLDPYGAEVLREIRGSRISLDESQRAEAEYQFGSVGALRKQLFGTVTITDKDAVSLDSKWAELSELYPDVFDPNTSAADMPGALLDAIDSLKNMGVSDMWYDKEAARQDLLQQIYDGYWRVSTLHTVADVKQKQINRLKVEHFDRLNQVKAQYQEAVQKLKAEHRAEMKKLREDLRSSSLEKQAEIRRQYQQARAKSVEGRNRTAMRHKVQRVVKDLNDLLLNGTKEKHVPIELQKAVAEALDAVNMDTVGAEDRISRLEEKLLKAKTAQEALEISRTIDRVRAMGDSMKGKLQALKAGYEEIIHSDDPLVAGAYDSGIAEQMTALMAEVGDTPLRDMSLRQLEAVHDVYTMVLTTIRNANKTFKAARNATVQELSQKVMGEVRKAGGSRKYSTPVMDAIRKFGWNNLKPVYAFELIGSDTFKEIFKNVRKGEDTWAVDVNDARDFYLEQAKKHGYNQWDMGKQYKFTATTGATFQLGLPQIMSLYAYSKREQAADHLRKGGIVIDESTEVSVKTKLGITMKFNPTEATAYNISDETLTEIVGKLTQEQKAYVDAMQEYLSTVMGEKGNEVSLQMYGIKLFGEKYYFPLKSAQQYMARAKEQQQGDRKIKNAGFSKQTVRHAGNPVVLSGFMDVWAEHVNEMSMYHAFVLPMEDFYRVWGYNTGNVEAEESQSVNAAIQNACGKGATAYIDQLLKDLNGGARMDATAGVINKSMNLFKKGAVFASMSVVIQQPSAIGRALAMIDAKYFAGPRIHRQNHQNSWQEVKKYAPVAAIKEMGYFDTNMGKSTKDYILGQEYEGVREKAKAFFTDSGYRDEALSRGAALADEITWCNIWEAVKRETRAKHPELNVKSEAFLQMAGERFTDVIVKTQVYDSVLSRSANMRSKDTGMKMATAFMAEPTTSINMVADALMKGKRDGVEGRRHCRRAIGSVVAAQILNSILVSFVYAARDDDEDETYLEKYLGAFVGGLTDSLNPATYIPFAKDIVSIVQGYDVERSDMAVVSDLWNAWKQLDSDHLTGWRKVENFAGSVCQIFGLPVRNIMRDARGMYQAVDTFTRGQKTTLAGLKYAVEGAITGEEVSDREQLYRAYLSGDEDHLKRVRDRYDGKDSYNAAMRTAIREHFLSGDIDEAEAQKYLNQYGAQDGSEAHWTVDAWKYAKANGTSEGYGKYDRFYTSVRTGKDLKAVIREYTDNGVSEYTLSRQITTYFKPMYVEMAAAERAGFQESLTNALELCGMERDAAMERIRDWDFEAQYGFSYDDRKQAYMDGKISGDQLQEILVKEGGYEKEEAAAQVEVYDWEKLGFESVTASRVEKYNTYCKNAGVSREAYMKIMEFSADTHNDVDENGETIKYSAVRKIMAKIDSLPIPDTQKEAIAHCFSWKEKTIQTYRLW